MRAIAAGLLLSGTALTAPQVARAQAVIVHNSNTSYNGTVTENADVYVGDGTSGTLNLGTGGTYTNTGTMRVGHRPGGDGTINATGGWNSNGDLIIGSDGGTGTVNLNGAAALRVGLTGTGSIYLSSNTTGTGRLRIGSAASSVSAGSIVFSSATSVLEFAHGSTAPYDFTIGMVGLWDAGTILQSSGITRLSGDSSGFGGVARVVGGTLLLDGSLGGAIDVQGGTLGGVGSSAGSVTVADGARLSPGGDGAVGTLTMGGLSLSGGSILAFDLGAPVEIGGTTNDLLVVNGNLTLDGTLDITNTGVGDGFGGGLYRLISYTGALNDQGLALGALPTGTDASKLEIQTAVAGQVNLFNAAAPNYAFWDGNNPALHGDGVIQGGSGTWTADSSGNAWTNSGGVAIGGFSPNPGLAIFAGSAGTVTLDTSAGAIGLTGMQFATDGYRLEGGTLDLASTLTNLRVGDGTSAGSGWRATIDTILAGSGGLEKNDLGTLVLSGINSYTGETRISAGTLELRGGSAIADGGAVTLGNVGSARLLVLNSETIGALSGGGTSGGYVEIAAGQLLTTGNGTSTSFGGIISGPGALAKAGSGTLTLSEANTFSGGTAVLAGTLIGGATNAFGSGATTVDGTLDIGGFNQQVASLAGSGTVTNNGTGRTLTISGSESTTFSGTIRNGSGVLGLVKAGSGTLTITGATIHSGAFAINGGSVVLDGLISGTGTLAVANGAAFGGVGSTTRTVTVASGGTIAPGAAGVGTLTVGGLNMSSGSRMAFQLGAPGASGASDRIQVNGAVTLNGAVVDVTDAGGFGPGVYRLIDYTDFLDGSGAISIGNKPVGTALSIQTAVDYQVNLVNSTGLTLQFWDGGDPALWNNGAVNGGSGTWSNSGVGWTDANGLVTAPMQPVPGFAVFQGTPGTVTLQSTPPANFWEDPTPVQFTGMQFASDGYSLGGDIVYLSPGDRIFRVGDGTSAGAGYTATINSTIQGFGTLVKTDLGTLVLTQANQNSGGVRIEAGTLRVSTGALGSGAVSMTGGVLDYASGAAISNALSGTLTLNQTGGSATQSGAIGSGSLSKTGDGTLTLSGSNNYSGDTVVQAGRLNLANAGAASSRSSYTVASGATLALSGGQIGALSGAGTVTTGGNNLAVGANNADGSYSGSLAGVGALQKLGSGTQILTGANTYSGGTVIVGGTLQIGDGGASGSITGLVINNGRLRYNRTGMLTQSGVISGFGRVEVSGGIQLTLTATNTYTGGTTIDNGSQLWISGTNAWIAGNVVNNGVFTISRAGSNTFTGTISGSGVFQQGTGELILTADSSFTGRTNVGGTLRLGDGGTTGSLASGTINLMSGGTLIANRSNDLVLSSEIAGAGSLQHAGSGTLVLTGAASHGGGTVSGTGTLQIGDGGTSGSIQGAITAAGDIVFNRSDDHAFTGSIVSAQNVIKRGAGTLTMNGLYSNTVIDSGTLRLVGSGAGGFETLYVSPVVNNGALVFDRSNATVMDGVISGSGSVEVRGGQLVTLRGANTYTGGTVITSGQLVLNTGSVVGDIVNQDRLVFASPGTFNGTISGTGTVRVSDAAFMTLTGAQSYTGATYIDGGSTLRLGGSLASRSIEVEGTLVGEGAGDFTVSGAISGQGALHKAGTGTMVLTGAVLLDGGAQITGGTLQIGDGGSTGSISGTITNDGVLAFHRDEWTFDSRVVGTGVLRQMAGKTILTNLVRPGGGTQILAVGTLQVGNGGTIGALESDVQNDGALVFARSDFFSFSHSVAGSGSLTQAGPGTLRLLNDNSYTGGTTIAGGTLQIGNGGTIGSIVGSVVNNGVLAFQRSDDVTFGGAISGTGSLQKLGTNVLTLTGENSFAGGTTILGGTLRIGNGGTTGTITGPIANSGTLTFERSDTSSYGGTISGAGRLVKAGAGTLVLTGDALHSGGTTIAAGMLQVGGGGTTGSIAADVVTNGTLAFNRSDLVTFGGPISGTGQLVQAGSGTLVLTGAATHSGGTTVAAGTLRVGDGATGGSLAGDVVTNGTLVFDRSDSHSFTGAISGTGQLVQQGSGTLVLAGAATHSGRTTIASGTLRVGNGVTGSLAGDVVNEGVLAFHQMGDVTFGGTISGTGSLEKLGANTLTLTADHSYAGGTTIAAGTLRIGDGGTSGSLVGAIINDGTLTFDRSDTSSFGGTISGSGQLVKAGAGALLLTGDVTHSGGTTVSAGMLQIGGGGTSGSLAGDVVTNSTLAFNRSDFVTFGGAISGSGRLVQAGSGTLILAGAATHSGGTTIASGTLRIGDGGTAGSLAGDVVNNGTLAFDRSDMFGFAGAISGTGWLVKTGSGTLVLTGGVTHSGGTSIASGALQIGNGGTSGSLAGNVVTAGTLIFNRSDDVSFAGTISGTGSLQKLGTNVLTLTGNNSFAGGTTIAGGTLRIGDGGTSGAIIGSVSNSGTLVFDRSDTLRYGGAISGAGRLVHAGSGTLVLTGSARHDGGTTVAGGTLQIGDGGTTGVLMGPVINSGTLVFNRSDTTDFSGSISGTGSLVQAGSGLLLLTSSHSFTGGTRVEAGGLALAGISLQGDVSVVGGMLGGVGSIAGRVTMGNGTLAGGQGQLLSMGALALDSGSTVHVGLGAPTSGGALFSVAGDLTLDGTLTVTDLGGFGAGIYRLFDYGGTLTDNGIAFGTLPAGIVAADLWVQTSTANRVNLVSTAGATLSFWDGSAAANANNGVVDGGAGTWRADLRGWTSADGSVNGRYSPNPSFAIFQGSAGAVTVDGSGGAIGVTGMQFAVDGYSLSGDTITLADPQSIVRVGDGSTAGAATRATIANVLGGAGGLVKSDLGTLILAGANSYTGGTTVSGGVLQIGDGGTSGSIIGDVVTNATLAFNRSDAATFGGAISGTGMLVQAGSDTLTLTGAATHSGGTTIASGTLRIGNGGMTGALAGDVVNNGTLVFDRARSVAFGGTVSGSGSLVQAGSGTLVLSTAHSYTGGTRIERGSLVLSGGSLAGDVTVGGGVFGGSGSVAGRVFVGNATLSAMQGQPLTMGALTLSARSFVDVGLGAPSGAAVYRIGGDLTLDGTLGVLDLGGFGSGIYRLFDYGGTLTDNGLEIGGTPTGVGSTDLRVQTAVAGQVNLVSTTGVTLSFWDGAAAANIDNGRIDGGTGVWRADGLGWTNADGTLNGRYSPNPTFAVFQGAAGAVTVDGSAGAIGVTGMQFAVDGYTVTGDAITLADAQTVVRVGDGSAAGAGIRATLANALVGTGGLAKSDLGTLVLTGTNSYSGGTTIGSGTLQIGNGGTVGAITGNVVNNATLAFDRSDAFVFGGAISGAGALVKAGGGTLTLTGSATHGGGTTIAAGTLRVGAGGTTGSLAGNVTNNGTLAFDRSDSLTVAGNIAGSGALVQAGSGTLVLAGAATHGGGTTISAGTLRIGNGGTTGSIAGSIANAGVLAFDRSDAATFAGTVTGSGRVVQAGSGTLLVTGALAHGGGTAITQGTLQLGTGGSLSGVVDLAGALAFARADAFDFAGSISGAGTLRQIGAGALTLSGNSSGFTGATFVTAGRLAVNGVLGASQSTLDVQGGATLAGTGTIGGRVALADGATLAGIQGQTLAMGALALSSGSIVDVTLGGSGTQALFSVAGDLTLDGTLNVTDLGGFGVGVYRLFDYAGALTDRGLAIGTLPGGSSADDAYVQTAVANQVNLVNSSGVTLHFWDGGNAANANNGSVDGGSGSWSNSGRNWTGADGRVNNAMTPRPGFAIFQGAAGTVRIDGSAGAVIATGMQFASDGYRLAGDALMLSGERAIVRVGDGSATGAGFTATIDAAIGGSAALVKTDLGTLVLTGANSYTGGTIVQAGTLVGNAASIRGDIDTAGTVVFDQAGDASFGGAISGSGTLVKQGAGALRLTGTNSADWSLLAGDLVSTSALFTGDLDIAANATFTFDQATNGVYAGSITGAGSIRFLGGGVVQLTAASSGFQGLTTIGESGTSTMLSVNGTLGGRLFVASGGTLMGNGTIGSTTVEGTIAPGNSIGALRVDGDLVFGASGTYQVEFNPLGQVDRIDVTGTATLGGARVVAIGSGGNYAPQTDYTILTAQGGVQGTFGGVTSDLAFLTPALRYAANSVVLRMQRNDVSFDRVARSFNQRSTAVAVEDLGFGTPLYTAVANLSAEDARGAFDQLSGEDHVTLRGALVEDSRFLRDAFAARGAVGGAVEGSAIWGQVLGSWRSAEGDGNASGYDRSVEGLIAGVEGALGANWRIGAAAGYSTTELRTDAGAEQLVETMHVGGYAAGSYGGFHVTLGAGYAAHEVNASRRVAFGAISDAANADHAMSTAQLFGEIGYQHDYGGFSLEPFAGIAHVTVSGAALQERAELVALRTRTDGFSASFGTIGVRASSAFDVGSVGMHLDAAVATRHVLSDRIPSADFSFGSGPAFRVRGLGIERSLATVNLGIGVDVGQRTSIRLDYDGAFGSRSEDHGVRAGLTVQF
ncbi:autotransporter-associated beta strand repeat-containing protein [Sphingosinithalassobacter sp. LHW66-3]|uniref:autotransporter-associated beta strand repeat-containing protein n=1 Tax=Sphingosinithalassobacter sp. LHW66-3 TaxID=3424718 RepID=UPI003D6A1228